MQATATAPDPAIDALAQDVYTFIASFHKNAACELFDKVAELDLSITQIKALTLLETAAGELSLGALAEELRISLPAASRSVEGLLRRGLVERREDADDRRMKRVRITDSGLDIAVGLAAGRMSALRELASSLTDTQRRRLADALAPVLARPEVAACRPKGPTP